MLRTNEDRYQADISITQSRYNALIAAEKEAEMLKSLIHEKAATFDRFTFEDIRLLDKLFNLPEELTEDSEKESPDAVEVVRCRDCKYYSLKGIACYHKHHNGIMRSDGFCSDGERKDND